MQLHFIKTIFLNFLCLFLLAGCDANNDLEILSSYPNYGRCSIDNPERNSNITSSNELHIRGWAFRGNQNDIPQTLTLYFVNEDTRTIKTIPINRGEKRGDVAKAFGDPKLEDSGFSGELTANALSPGKYKLILLQADQYTEVVSCGGEPHYITVQ